VIDKFTRNQVLEELTPYPPEYSRLYTFKRNQPELNVTP